MDFKTRFEQEALRIIKAIVADMLDVGLIELRRYETRTNLYLNGRRVVRLHEGSTGTLSFAVLNGPRIPLSNYLKTQ